MTHSSIPILHGSNKVKIFRIAAPNERLPKETPRACLIERMVVPLLGSSGWSKVPVMSQQSVSDYFVTLNSLKGNLGSYPRVHCWTLELTT